MIYAATTRLAETALRLRAGLGGSSALRERLVMGGLPDPAAIWVHGASVGELTSARPVIEALNDELGVIVTSNSETGRDMASRWGLPSRLAPLDMPGSLSRFMDAVQPRLQITLENEFWPLRSRRLAERGIPQAMIGARMSQRSALLWSRLPGVIGPMLGRVAALSAQDAQSEARLRDLGLTADALMPQLDLKLLTPASLAPPQPDASRDQTVLAASTHEGEEPAIIDGWRAARQTRPDLRLIIAIRHPQRGDAVAALMAAQGLPVARRSEGADTGPILLIDVLGEMPRWYAKSGICFVGGSWAEKGGHTPWEPAAHCCAILHGPHISNFTDAYATLSQSDAARRTDAGAIGQAIADLADDPAAARRMGHKARRVLEQQAGDPAMMVRRLADLAVSRQAADIV